MAGRTAYMLVAQDYVMRQMGVEVLRQQIINLWVSRSDKEYCAILYRFMPHRRLSMVVPTSRILLGTWA